MSAPRPETGSCKVVGGEKLPPEIGGANVICGAIEQAVARRVPKARYSAEVRILSKSGLKVKLVAGGHELPEQSFHVMDRNLNSQSIGRFADAIAELVANATKS
jgi:hypothetical protein